MTELPRPGFAAPRRGRRGYDREEVDRFVELVLARVEGRPGGEAVTAADLGVMVFHSAPRGAPAYDSGAVDAWLERARPVVAQAETQLRSGPADESAADSVIGMATPPHFTDRFPRVSRVIVGFSVEQVDALLASVRQRLIAGEPIDPEEVSGAPLTEERGGYRQSAVTDVLDLLALALQHEGS